MPAATRALPASAERYLANLETQRRLSVHTLSSYRHELTVLQQLSAADVPAVAIEALRDAQIRRYAARLHARGLGPRSIARALSAWRGYFTWLALYEDGAGNPVADVRPPKAGKRLPKALSETQTMQLLDGNKTDDAVAIDLRDAAIYELFYSSGLRLAELVALDIAYAPHGSIGWLDLSSGEVTVTGKGNKRRTVPVGAVAATALRTWIAVRGGWVKTDPHPLFLSTRGERLSGRTIQDRLKAHAQRAGVPANVHPHVLRHSFASHLLQASGDLRAVQELLGHASIAATQVYTSLDFKRLAEVYDAAHPRARRK
ncbi:MAG: tyrosine recombinase XerC [Burkholderiaceae bacterium]